MGNTQGPSLRNVITEGDEETLTKLLQDDKAEHHLNLPLNKKGDTAIILACRQGKENIVSKLLDHGGVHINATNKDLDTALDVTLDKALPADGDILHQHFCPYSSVETRVFHIPNLVKLLLKKGAKGKSLERLILFCMKKEDLIAEICDLLEDLTEPTQYRISGLLLQTSVWFDQSENLENLLNRGVDIDNFWKVSFMPRIQRSTYHRPVPWPREEAAEYDVEPIPDSDAVQSLKFSFIQDWRADWNDGENPPAQYRAGLQVTPDSAILFARAANRYDILMHVVQDVLSYLPVICSGPNLNQTSLLQSLMLAGYNFSEDEIQHLHLKFNIDFSFYRDFICSPQPLKHLARISFRKNLKSNVFYCLGKLDYLPEAVKNYLTLNDSVSLESNAPK